VDTRKSYEEGNQSNITSAIYIVSDGPLHRPVRAINHPSEEIRQQRALPCPNGVLWHLLRAWSDPKFSSTHRAKKCEVRGPGPRTLLCFKSSNEICFRLKVTFLSFCSSH
jgi:hypothetical protein